MGFVNIRKVNEGERGMIMLEWCMRENGVC